MREFFLFHSAQKAGKFFSNFFRAKELNASFYKSFQNMKKKRNENKSVTTLKIKEMMKATLECVEIVTF